MVIGQNRMKYWVQASFVPSVVSIRNHLSVPVHNLNSGVAGVCFIHILVTWSSSSGQRKQNK